MPKRLSLAICFLTILVCPSNAAQPQFLDSAAVDVVSLLPPPPVVGSAEDAADMEAVLKAQITRSDAEVARCKSESKLSPAAFQTVLGPDFTIDNFPQLYSLLEDAGQDSKVFSGKAKEHFARPRPKIADKHVQPVVDGDDEPTYPSGHATRAMLWARILIEIAPPEKKIAILERAQEIGWDRVLIGVHYPSDVYAGRVLGQALAQSMFKNAEFQKRLNTAKEEFKAFSVAHPDQARRAASIRLIRLTATDISWSRVLRRASSSISGVMSIPIAFPFGPTFLAARKTSRPPALPRSTTTSPGRKGAKAVGFPRDNPMLASAEMEASSPAEYPNASATERTSADQAPTRVPLFQSRLPQCCLFWQ